MYSKTLGVLSAAAFLFTVSAVLADDQMKMQMSSQKPSATAEGRGYRFELAGLPKPEAGGKNIVAVRLMHNGKPVTGAIIIQSTANMSPIGMAAMGAPASSLGEQPPGTYRFEVANGSVWKKPDNWALILAAKVQGESQTVRGNVVVKLSP
jgi:hypothetical protein